MTRASQCPLQDAIYKKGSGYAFIYIPAAATVFPGEIYRAPRSWTERSYHKLSYSTRSTEVVTSRRGEQPEVFSDEIRAAFRSVR